MKKKNFSFFGSLLLILLSVLFGNGATLAVGIQGAPLPDAGVTIDGIATVESGKLNEPDLYMKTIDDTLVKMRPMATPVEQISREQRKSLQADAWIVKYYSVGTRPISTKVTTKLATAADGDRFIIQVADPKLFTKTHTLRFEGLAGYKEDGVTLSGRPLVGYVVGKSDAGGMPIVQLVNYKKTGGCPDINVGTVVTRMGRGAAELDAQTGVFTNVPSPDLQYCQNFMMQIEQSTFDKMHEKEVNWTFSDLEEDSIFEMKMDMEGSFLFGEKKIHKDVDGNTVYLTGGIYYMAGKEDEIGTFANGETTITTKQLNALAKKLFTGNDAGNKVKIAFCGSDMLESLSNITDGDRKIIERDTVEKWNLKFKSFDTNFGEVLAIHHELMDKHNKSNEMFIVDPAFMTKATFLSWNRKDIDFDKLGVRKTNAVVLQEASCLYLRYPNAHAVVKLKKA